VNREQFREAIVLDEYLEDLFDLWNAAKTNPHVCLKFFDDKTDLAHMDIPYDEEFMNHLKGGLQSLVVRKQARLKELGVDVE
jgi:hypothetical protein